MLPIEDPAYWYSDAYLDFTDDELAIEYAEFIETKQAMNEIIHECNRRGLTLNDLEQIYLLIDEATKCPYECRTNCDGTCTPLNCVGLTD